MILMILQIQLIGSIAISAYAYQTGGIEQGIVDSFVGDTFSSCMSECENSNRCYFAKYLIKFHLCNLFDDTVVMSLAQAPGVTLYRRRTPAQTCNVNSDEPGCKPKTCPVPPPLPGIKIFGNMLKIGSKLKLQCKDSTPSWIITCQENGTWSNWNSFCPCKPDNIEHGHASESQKLNSTHFIVNITCNAGYFLRQNDNVTCNVANASWTLENARCDTIYDGEWQLIYKYPIQTSLTLVGNLQLLASEDIDTGFYGFFRNKTVFVGWESMNISRVKFAVKDKDTTVAFLVFNGTGSKHNQFEWFSKPRLLNSSWSDLTSTTSLAMFSIAGIATSKANTPLRFFISKTFNKTGACADDLGWFVVTWAYYPCDINVTGKRILYAKHSYVSSFITQNVSFADGYEIWMDVKP